MKDKIILLAFAVLLLTMTSCTQYIYPEGKYSGVWRLKVLMKNDSLRYAAFLDALPKTFIIDESNGIINADSTASFDTQLKDILIKNDSLNFDVDNPLGRGKAKLNFIKRDQLIGTFRIATDGLTQNLSAEFQRVWCCGNHTPRHCDDALTRSCKKISSQ